MGSNENASPKASPPHPTSATHWAVGLSGVCGFAVAFALLLTIHPFSNTVYSVFFLLIGLAVSVSAVDLLWGKVHERPTTGLDFGRWRPSPARAFVKFVGLLGSVGFLALLYALFREYSGDFYARYFDAVELTLPVGLTLSVPYIYWIDGVMISPKDGLWQVGMLVLLRFDRVDLACFRQHILGWLVKGFFLPLMFTYMCRDFDALLAQGIPALDSFKAAYDYFYDFLYFIDVCFATVGYVFSLRLIDTHLRSTESTALGWMAALLCYEPFWSLISTQYLAYDPDHPWGEWLKDEPLLYGVWGSLILALVAVYAWATVMFGCRFSNLTNRGILTNGPYRFTKHPAYIAKNLSWWMISLPFLGEGGWQAGRHAALLLMLNGVYALRAWTEERHLSRDTAYLAYMSWIKRNGLFRFFGSATAAATLGRARVIRERS
jgi:protein-S-isoprenylcysteine O-methyltransferase Ste14